MQYNSLVPRQTAGQNQTKLLNMFNYISKIVPWSTRVTETNFEKIAYGGSCKQDEALWFALKKLEYPKNLC